jgi:hypothetical protein
LNLIWRSITNILGLWRKYESYNKMCNLFALYSNYFILASIFCIFYFRFLLFFSTPKMFEIGSFDHINIILNNVHVHSHYCKHQIPLVWSIVIICSFQCVWYFYVHCVYVYWPSITPYWYCQKINSIIWLNKWLFRPPNWMCLWPMYEVNQNGPPT